MIEHSSPLEEFSRILNLLKQYIIQKIASPNAKITSGLNIIMQETEYPRYKLDEFERAISSCRKCPLGRTRINFVFGSGSPQAELMFIGEGPGYEEDRQGKPFVGEAGKLLTKIIESIGLKREDVYIANIVKCHPMKDPENPQKRQNDRPPSHEEIAVCRDYINTQIQIIRPRIICCLGTIAAQTLLNSSQPIMKLRGRFYDYNGMKLIPTIHPAACLYHVGYKRYVWEDMKLIKRQLENYDEKKVC